MIILKEFPDVQFANKEAAFAHLRQNAEKIIALKKAEIHKSFEKGCISSFLNKVTADETKAALGMKQGYIYPVINTTNYMDSHSDVHFNGIWDSSIKQNKGSIYYVADHDLKLNSVIAYPEDVKVYTKELPWGLFGKDYPGETQALIFEISEEKLVNETARKAIADKRKLQNSVRMQYVKIRLALNSEAQEDQMYKAYFDEKLKVIANKAQVLEQGYFWGVEEAKIVKEGSMVLFGSNDATPILSPNNDENSEGNKGIKNHPSNDNGEQPPVNVDFASLIKTVNFKF